MPPRTEGASRAEAGKLLRFGLVGLLNTGVDALCFFLLRGAGLFLEGSQVVAYIAGTANSYLWNSRWTFRREAAGPKAGQALKFLAVNLVSLGGSLAAISLAARIMPEWAAKGCSIVVSMGLNYLGQRLWVFKVLPIDSKGKGD